MSRGEIAGAVVAVAKTIRVAFVVDGHEQIGGGHVLRSLTLAAALNRAGAETTFLGGPFIRDLVARYGDGATTWTESAPSGSAAFVESAAAAVSRLDAALVGFDHYGLGAFAHRAIAGDRRSVAIDELIDRPIGADVVVDPTPGRTPDAYARIAPGARLLLGPAHALVRPAFAERRARGGRDAGLPVRRILLTMGLTDLGGITARVADLILPCLGERRLDVVIGRDAPSRAALDVLSARDGRVSILEDVRDMADLMGEADLCLGAGGGTTWERCSLGLPTLLTVIADNQRAYAQAVREVGAAIVLDARDPAFERDLPEAFVAALADGALRRRMSDAALSLCDGLGAERVAAVALDPEFRG